MKFLLCLLIKLYQLTLRPILGQNCRFYPSCSEYSCQAIEKQGVIKGLWLSVKRIGKCGPWHPGGVDFVD